MVNIAIVGYGNLGRGVASAIERNEDMKLVAVFSRRPEIVRKDIKNVPVFNNEDKPSKREAPVDVAILCGGSKEHTPVQGPVFAARYNTVDSFDTHAEIPNYYKKMDATAKKAGNV